MTTALAIFAVLAAAAALCWLGAWLFNRALNRRDDRWKDRA